MTAAVHDTARAGGGEFVLAPARFLVTARERGADPAYYMRDEAGWQPTSWQDYAAQVQQAARALVALGVQPGQAVCILGFNRPEWVIMDLAAMMVGAVAAGIYWTSAPGEVEYIIRHSGGVILLAEDDTQWAKLQESRSRLPGLRRVVMMKGTAATDSLQMDWDAFLALGTREHQPEVDRRLSALRPDDLGTLIYTSGTTGMPKAVMLSHGTLAWTGMALAKAFGTTPADRLISYLPLAHVAEQLGAIHNHVAIGYRLYFARSLEALRDHLTEVRPTVFFGVPRVWEKIHAGIAGKLDAATDFKAVLAAWALSVGRRWHEQVLQGREPGGWLNLQKAWASRLVYDKVKAALGMDQARLLISAAAPIAPETLRFFTGLDLLIREGYGQSEACGPTTVSLAGSTRIGSVGKPLAGTEVRIAPDGEIQVRGPHVFQGYLGMPEDTAQTLVDGWLQSGDLGHFDVDGYLYVSGRKKDLLITSGGKNISPANLEAELMDLPLVEHGIVCGDGRHFLTALLTLKPDALETFLQAHGVQGLDMAVACRHPLVLAELQKGIDDINRHQARVAWIRKFTVLPEPLSIDTGALTATMKIKRKVVLERHREAVEAMYRD
ncbi:AMP-dependent synthetase/ligase [Hydrogenophaga bisanensis]|uniref:AMP-dependent synthetase/ligase n=1 Tax=Hydrogenophaga bisanensis TaxID=439611 RepID=A0ABW2R7Y5_9BURK